MPDMLVILCTNVLLDSVECATNISMMTGVLPRQPAYKFSRVQTKVDHSCTSHFNTMGVNTLLTLIEVMWLS